MAASQSPTKSGTRKLSDVARHVVVPTGVTSSGWPAVKAKCADLGIRFDDWQEGVGRLILAKRASGKYAAGIGGVVMSLPRQIGKTFMLGAIVFALCMLRPGLTVIWTAHRARTAGETFDSMQGMARRKKIKPFVSKVVLGSGDEEIRFKNGSRILFGARERGFGRGFAKVDVIVFDEAQILTENAIDDMVPATNQAENPLLLFTGTPPKPTDPGEVFARKRREALAGQTQDAVYIECSADKGADPMDRKQWAIANPSHPRRTPADAMLRMIANLTPDSQVREMLGIWDDDSTKRRGVIDMNLWSTLKVKADPPTKALIVVDVAPGLDWTTVSVAAPGADGRTLLLVDRTEGTGQAVAKVVGLVEDLEDVVEVALTPTAKIFSAKLTAAEWTDRTRKKRTGIEHKELTSADVGRGCTSFQEAVRAGEVAHVGQPELDDAVGNAITRYVGDTQQWDRRDHRVDISCVVAGSVAVQRWALLTAAPDTPPPSPVRAGSPGKPARSSVATAGF